MRVDVGKWMKRRGEWRIKLKKNIYGSAITTLLGYTTNAVISVHTTASITWSRPSLAPREIKCSKSLPFVVGDVRGGNPLKLE